MANQLFAKKDLNVLLAEAGSGHDLKRVLGTIGLTSLGVGAIIGAGIFVLTGTAAAKNAGPAIVLSFILSGIGCAFAGLCYAEMASMIPIAGSAYTYSYATMGELLAWIIGWDLILEYSLGASTVAVGWSSYVVSFLNDYGWQIPPQLIAATGTVMANVPSGVPNLESGWKPLTKALTESLAEQNVSLDSLATTTAWLNVPAVLIVALLTGLLVFGIQESASVNNAMVMIKVAVVIMFIVAGSIFLWGHPEKWTENWSVFIPDSKLDSAGKPIFGEYGWSGIVRGSAVIFFAYIGFDAVSTAAQEAKNPQRDMPIGILGSLAVCTVLYIAMAVVLTAIVNYKNLGVAAPVAEGIDSMGSGYHWLRPLIKIGAIAGLSSVILVMLLAQPRIFFSMSRDGLLPPFISKVHPRYKTPYITTIVTGAAVAVAAAIAPIDLLGELVSIGTLLAFALVCGGVLWLRYTQPDLPRVFRTPFAPVTCTLGVLVCVGQMVFLPLDTWLRLLIWMALGIVIYFGYGYWHSKMRVDSDRPATAAPRDNLFRG